MDLSDVPHSEAVKILREAESPVNIVVLREVTDEDQISLALSVCSNSFSVTYSVTMYVSEYVILGGQNDSMNGPNLWGRNLSPI